MAKLLIGRRICETRKVALQPHEAAYVLRCSENDVRNMLRRGERYQEQGIETTEIAERGALTVTRSGGRRRADIRAVAQLAAGDELALAVLAALVEGRATAPRAASSSEPAPDLLASLASL